MRKLLILAAGAALLSTPAFAQAYGPYGPPPYPPMPPAVYYMPPPPPPPPPPGYYPAPAYYPAPTYYPAPSYASAPVYSSAPTYSAAPAPTGRASTTRLYVSTATRASGSVLSNQPVRDTPGTRALWPPLSRAGWRTAPRGN